MAFQSIKQKQFWTSVLFVEVLKAETVGILLALLVEVNVVFITFNPFNVYSHLCCETGNCLEGDACDFSEKLSGEASTDVTKKF